MTVSALTPDMARRLRAAARAPRASSSPTSKPAARRSAAAWRRGDVLLQVNRRPVTSVGEAARELGRVASGSTAFLLVLRNGQESFVTVRKE